MRRLNSKWQLGGYLAAVAITASPVFAFQQPGQKDLQFQTENEREIQTAAEQRRENPNRGPQGEFTSLHQDKITIKDESGEIQTFKTTDRTQVIRNGKPAKLQDLQEGDQIGIVMGPGLTALRVVVNPGAARPQFPLQQNQKKPAGRNPQTTEERNPLPDDPNSLLPPKRGDQNPPQRRESRDRPDRQDSQQNKQGELDNENPGSTAWLGLMLRNAEDQRGVQIVRTYPSGPASRAGLRSGDQLIEVAGKAISTPEEVSEVLRNKQPDEQIELTVLRGNREQTLNATLGSSRDFLGEIHEGLPRRRDLGNNQQDQGSDFSNEGDEMLQIPEHAMMLEQHRRLAEQHQRLEEKLDKVLEELQALKKQMGQQPRARNTPRN